MALVLKDRVKETTTTTGTGTYTLAGAVVGYQAFSVIGNANTTYYAITNGTDWEVGLGTYTLSGTALSRDTILESSNSGNAVNWSAGVKDIFCTYPAERSMYVDGTTITPAISARLGFTNLAQGSALSVLGVTGNATADNASIAAGTDNQVLRRSGTSVAFGAVNLASTDAVTGDLPFSNLAQGSALSVLGVTGNATADNASIAAGTDNQVLRRSGTTVAFGAVNLAQSAAITGTLPVGNGGTGITSFGAGVATWLGTPSSANLAAAVTDETGSGSLVFATSPTLVTPVLGVASATSINKVAITAPATSATLTIANGKTLTANASLTLAGTDATTMTFPGTSQTVAGLGLAQTFTAAQTFRAASAIRSEAASTQDAIVIAGRAGGTSSYAVTITPTTLSASRTLTLANGDTTLQAGTMAVTGTGLGQFASTTSLQLAGVISDETGSGSLVFATSPTLVTPLLGTPTSGNLTNCTADGTNKVGYLNIPAVADKTTSYSLATGDIGKVVGVGSGGSITIPNSTFAAGDAVLIFNNTAGDITITCTITTAYIAGTDADVASVTLATRGVCNILFLSGTACVLTGNIA